MKMDTQTLAGRFASATHRVIRGHWLLAGSLTLAATFHLGAAAQASMPLGETDSFLAAVEANAELSTQQKQSIQATFERLVAEGISEKDAVTQCLTDTYPDYQNALQELDSDNVAAGVKRLQGLMAHNNKFLAADAAFHLGRAYLATGQHEEALQPLSQLSGDWSAFTLRDIESLYYLGTAQAGLLKNQEAMDTLIRFLQEDIGSPERLKMGAYSQVVKLQKIRQDSLEDAQSRMEYSQRRLELNQPDAPTQEQQQKVVQILGKLIEEAQKKECSSNCKGGKCNKPSDSQKPGKKPGDAKKPGQKPGQSSGASNMAAGPAVEQSFDNGPVSIWSQLRDRSRDPANAAVKEQLPPEYRKLIERYYREMSDGSERPNQRP